MSKHDALLAAFVQDGDDANVLVDRLNAIGWFTNKCLPCYERPLIAFRKLRQDARVAAAKSYLRRRRASPKPKTYFIQDTRQYVGNCVLWWVKDGAGYTTHLSEAWEVDEATAARMHRNRETDTPWPADQVRQAASMQVDVQRLRRVCDGEPVEPKPRGERIAMG